MNENETQRIAAAINQLRPDWPTASIATLIATKLGSRPRRDVAVALAWVACEADSKTPARVLEAGPWWRATAPDGDRAPRPPKPHEACRDCGRHFDRCDCDGGPTIRVVPPAPDVATHVKRLRDLAAQATADLCSHGAPFTNCKDHPPTQEDA